MTPLQSLLFEGKKKALTVLIEMNIIIVFQLANETDPYLAFHFTIK